PVNVVPGLSVRFPDAKFTTAPANLAVLFPNALWATVAVPRLSIAPPLPAVPLPEKLLFVWTVSCPLFQIAPPPSKMPVPDEVLRVTVQPATVVTPSAATAPPEPAWLPVNVAPVAIRVPLLLSAPPPTAAVLFVNFAPEPTVRFAPK